MIIVEDYEAIRRAYYIEKKSIRQIAREQHHSRTTIRKAIDKVQPQPYQLRHPKLAPIFGSFQHRVDELLAKNKTLPPKQRYTTHKNYEILVAEGYQGSESRVKLYVAQWKKEHKPPARISYDNLATAVKLAMEKKGGVPTIQSVYHVGGRMNLSITRRAIGSEKMETSIVCRVDATSFHQEKKGFS